MRGTGVGVGVGRFPGEGGASPTAAGTLAPPSGVKGRGGGLSRKYDSANRVIMRSMTCASPGSRNAARKRRSAGMSPRHPKLNRRV